MHSLIGVGGGDGLAEAASPVAGVEEAFILEDAELGVIKNTWGLDPTELLLLRRRCCHCRCRDNRK